jgi:amino acid transporter
MEQPALERRLGTGDAVVIGLGSMIGAGVFSAFGPAARAAGAGLLIGLVLAAVIAYCNATASAQLAAVYPTSGGTYIYGRERLGPWWGFLAGWGFVIGKTASCAAMALTFASYAIPGPGTPHWLQRIAAIAAVVALSALNYQGVTKTAVLARILVACTLIALTAFVVGIALASLGALLALIAGLGRTTLAMARNRDLPSWLAAVHPRHRVPHHADIALGVVVCVLVATVDLRGVIGFSSFGVLIYYTIANAAAYTLPEAGRWARVRDVCGVAGCLLLVATLPWQSAVAGLGVFAIGVVGRALVLRRRT